MKSMVVLLGAQLVSSKHISQSHPLQANAQPQYPMGELLGVDGAIRDLRSAVLTRFQETMQINEAAGLTEFVGGLDLTHVNAGGNVSGGEQHFFHKHAVAEFVFAQRTVYMSAMSLTHIQSTNAFRTHAWALDQMVRILDHEAWRTLSLTMQLGPLPTYKTAGASLQRQLGQLGALAKGIMGAVKAPANGVPVMGFPAAKAAAGVVSQSFLEIEAGANKDKDKANKDKGAHAADKAPTNASDVVTLVDAAAPPPNGGVPVNLDMPSSTGLAAAAMPTAASDDMSEFGDYDKKKNMLVTRLGSISTNLGWLADLYAGIDAQAAKMRGELTDMDEGVTALLTKTTSLPGAWKVTLPTQLLHHLVWLNYVAQTSGNIVSQMLNLAVVNPTSGVAATSSALRLMLDYFRLQWQHHMADAFLEQKAGHGWGHPWPIVDVSAINKAPWVPPAPWMPKAKGSIK